MLKYLERDERWTLIKEQTTKKIMGIMSFKFGATEDKPSSGNDQIRIKSAEPDEKDDTAVDFQ